MLFRPVQPSKADLPIDERVSGRVAVASSAQSRKTLAGKIVILAGTVTARRALQPRKASEPIEVRLPGNTIPERDAQPEKARAPIDITESESGSDASAGHRAKASGGIAATESGTTTVWSRLQSLKAPSPREVNDPGRLAVRRPEKRKASLPINVTELGIPIDNKPEHPSKAARPIERSADVKLADTSPWHPAKVSRGSAVKESGTTAVCSRVQ
mmetsp:Transcript_10394/g.31286  ORF Transcript_10394/g.31286 Transcript_10394/m.31286 type:complete len:214 (+) Transcript_10394:3120-3761(+)